MKPGGIYPNREYSVFVGWLMEKLHFMLYTPNMGILDRLGSVLKSYVNDGFGQNRSEKPFGRSHDDDYNAAFEELEGFLNKDKAGGWQKEDEADKKRTRPVPPELKADFAELGINPNATEEECKEAYKKLLKIHHPDKHNGNPELTKKATEKSARINAAYDRLEKWYKLA